MERLLTTHPTQLRSIGISNFSIPNLTALLASPDLTVIPAVNQLEMHPHLPDTALKAFCESKGIQVVAYSPLGAPPAANEQEREKRSKLGIPSLVAGGNKWVKGIADKYGVSEGTVVLSWGVKRGTAVIPKSANPKRMKDNINVLLSHPFSSLPLRNVLTFVIPQLIDLSDEDMKELDGIHKEEGQHTSLIAFYAEKPGVILGWTYEQLGWDMDVRGRITTKP